MIKLNSEDLECSVLLYNLAITCPFVHVVSNLCLILGEVLVLYLYGLYNDGNE